MTRASSPARDHSNAVSSVGGWNDFGHTCIVMSSYLRKNEFLRCIPISKPRRVDYAISDLFSMSLRHSKLLYYDRTRYTRTGQVGRHITREHNKEKKNRRSDVICQVSPFSHSVLHGWRVSRKGSLYAVSHISHESPPRVGILPYAYPSLVRFIISGGCAAKRAMYPTCLSKLLYFSVVHKWHSFLFPSAACGRLTA